jgi:hypothetical protein
MPDFREYGDIFSDRYDRSVAAAAGQRRKERESSEDFGEQVQADLSQVNGGPVPPTGPSTGEDTQFDPGMDEQADQNVERTKDYLIEVSKKRLNRAANTQD